MLLTILKKAGSWYERLEELLLVCLVLGMVALGAGTDSFPQCDFCRACLD